MSSTLMPFGSEAPSSRLLTTIVLVPYLASKAFVAVLAPAIDGGI